jgi:hypothetical protein
MRPTPRLFSVFFPSLSITIVWKAGPVSRVRFAAQIPRALDTVPPFQEKKSCWEESEGKEQRNENQRGCCKLEDFNRLHNIHTNKPSDLSLLQAKNGLDNGVHFSR